ncbi:MAG: T9SS type A sorting domain-containing protein [Vicingaceae bacterium]|nr:T9SS type A sorting domain-containing protein [Vicingaceae bacterium]
MKNILFTILMLFFALKTTAQQPPEFKFYLAFEDANNTKDTLWYVLDSTATWGIDTALGEKPQDLTSSAFHVYMYITSAADSGKTFAYPSISCGFSSQIRSQNYVYPIIVRWDTSLLFNHNLSCTFNEVIFDNDWFFFNPNTGHGFSLLLQDSVVLPSFTWGSQDHFPLTFILNDNPNLSVEEKVGSFADVQVYPNPTVNEFTVEIEGKQPSSVQLVLMDISGRVMQQLRATANKTVLNLQDLPQGVYFLEVLSNTQKVTKKIIKN